MSDRYWRLYEIPRILATRGHEVIGLLLSYRPREEGSFDSLELPRLRWMSVNAGLPCLSGMLRYFRTLAKTLDNFRPDIVWASSDVLHAAVAWAFCRPREIPYVVDLYDNYESFGLTKIPGMALLLRVGCRGAAGLTVISHGLDQWIASAYKTTAPRRVIGNAVPKDLFYPRDRSESRKILGLPAQARLIGTAGAIKRGRGIEALFKAFLKLAQDDPGCWLAFAGPRDDSPARYPHARIIDLGILEPERVPWMISALDVAVICNVDSDFGRFCFPQKFYEMIACDVPVVAAEVGELKTLLSDWPDCLYPVDSVEGLAKKIRSQLDNPVRPRTIAVRTWDHEAAQLEAFFEELVYSRHS